MAAANLAGEDSRAGLSSDIGVEEIVGGAAQGAYFRDPREQAHDRHQRRAGRIAVAGRRAGRPSRDMGAAVREFHWRGEIVGCALRLQAGENLHIGGARGVRQTAPEGFS